MDYNTYIKLYENESLTKQIGNDNIKIVANLRAGHTYYLIFSGFLMRRAKGRVTVKQGATIEFKKRTDSSFIYVNSPEFITRIDIVDDECHLSSMHQGIDTQPYLKIFEQENVIGKNTYYQTHMIWYGSYPEIYEPTANFYIDVDFYNPTDNDITLSISNLAYGTEYNVLENYYDGYGIDTNISIPAHEHKLLFETLNSPLMMSHPGPTVNGNGWDWDRHCSPVILFDFQVNSGNVSISSLAAYNRSNLKLRNGSKNILDSVGKRTDSGEVITELTSRPNEDDLYGKYKGVAKNQSAWIDANLDFVIDDSTDVI